MTSTTDQLRVVFPHISEDTIAQVVGQLAPNFPGDADRLLDRATSELLRGNYENKKKKLAPSVDVDTGEEHRIELPANAGRDMAAEKAEILKFIEGMAPNVDLDWLSKHYETFVLNGDHALRSKDHIQALLANYILEHSDYPKKKQAASKPVSTNKDYTAYADPITSADYRTVCLEQLQQDFRWVSLPSVRSVLNNFGYHYCPAYRYLKADLKVPADGGKPTSEAKLGLLSKERVSRYVERWDPEFAAEYDYTHADEIKAKKEAMAKARQQKEDEEAERLGQVMECGCCFLDVPIHRMVQCAEGHLFCNDCIKKYVEETVYASGQTTVHCLDQDGCKANFPLSELERAVPAHQLTKIFARLADLDIKKAGLENVHQCPHCDFQMEIANPDEKIFACQNPECRIETCLLCKEPNHIPLRCEEVEKQNVTDYRKKVEEAMTASLVRQCPKCKAKFFKTEGCNKMTCSCGAHVCYVCRVLITAKDGYSHFCAHDRNPREFGACPQCNKCFLFLKSTEASDKELVEQAKKDMSNKLAQDNPELAAVKVGFDDPAPANGKKKTKKGAHQHQHQQQYRPPQPLAYAQQMMLNPFGQVAQFVGGLFGAVAGGAMNAAPPAPAIAVDYMGRLQPVVQPAPPAVAPHPPPAQAVPAAAALTKAPKRTGVAAPPPPPAVDRDAELQIIDDLPTPTGRVKRGRSSIPQKNFLPVRPVPLDPLRVGEAANPIEIDDGPIVARPRRDWGVYDDDDEEEEEEEEDESYEFDHQDDYDEDDFDEEEENY